MKNHRFKIILLGLVLASTVLAILYATREPSVDGRTLSEWLRRIRESQSASDNSDATNAIRKIGVKAIPVLLEKFEARQPAWKSHLASGWGQNILPDRWLYAADYERQEALIGFQSFVSKQFPAGANFPKCCSTQTLLRPLAMHWDLLVRLLYLF